MDHVLSGDYCSLLTIVWSCATQLYYTMSVISIDGAHNLFAFINVFVDT